MNSRHWMMLALLVAAGLPSLRPDAVALAAGAGDRATEAMFREARGYTVRVRVRVENAFLGDEAGAWSGAGFLVDAERGWLVTNAHVAAQSPAQIEVAFEGEAFRPARRVYVD